MTDFSGILDAAVSAAEPTLLGQLTSVRDAFATSFGHLSRDKDLLARAFEESALAQMSIWRSKTLEEVQDAKRTRELALDALASLGIEAKVVGEAEAGPLLRRMAHLALLCLAAGAGAGAQFGIEAAFPGVGLVLGPMVGAGVKAGLDELATLV